MIKSQVIKQISQNVASMTAIVEPTTNCNLRCKYCFAGNKDSKIMSFETLRMIIESILEFNGKDKISKFIWHGGEPLLAGLDFLNKIVEFQEPYTSDGFKIANAIQTNMINISDSIITFLKDNEFGVGSSLDYPKEVHNYYRNNSFDQVYENIAYSKSKGLHVGVICILSKRNINSVNEIYSFFNDAQLDFSLTPVIPNKSFNVEIITPDEYFSAIKELFDIWFNDHDCNIRINPCDGIIQAILLKGVTLTCIHSENCLNNFLTFLPNGDVFPCNRFTDYADFKIGNLNKSSFEEILNSDVRKRILLRIPKNIPSCRNCKYIKYCKGGCMNHAYEFYHDVFKKDYYCTAFFRLFEYINTKVTAELEHAKINQ